MSEPISYFDNAATSWPKPATVYAKMLSSFQASGGNPGRGGHALAMAAEHLVAGARHRVAKLLNAEKPERIVFTHNATDALNIAIKGLLRPGDHAIASVIDHNSVIRPLRGLEQRSHVTLSLVGCAKNGVIDPTEVAALIRPTTRLIVLSHASNVTGAIQPVAQVAALAQERGIVLLVDASQTAGLLPIDVQAWGVGMLAAAGHKSLCGPTGTGVLYVREGIDLAHFREGGSGTHSEDPQQPQEMPYRLEAGTPNTLGIAGLEAGIAFIVDTSSERMLAHERALATTFREGLARIEGATVYGPSDPALGLGIVSMNLAGLEPTDLAAILDQSFQIAVRAGLHCAPHAHQALGTAPSGTVRFSFGFFNTLAQVERAVAALGEIAASV